jgi:uncharacterized membrane protein YdjX (TVP38/TMEM64 family)/glutaredoxin
MEGIMKVFLYTLSTCPWCHKAKQFFKKKQIPFDYVDYDLQPEQEQEKIMEKMLKLTGERVFPVVVIGSQVVMGYDPEKYSEAMGLKEEKPSRRIWLFRLKLSILVVFIVTMGTLVWLKANMMLFDINRIMAAVQRLGEIGPIAYMFTRALTVIILLPSLPLDAMAGARFGVFLGSIYSIMGDEAGGVITVFFARLLGREAITRLFRKDIAFCDECAERQLVYVVFFARLLPMISFGLISYGAGLTRISLRAFALATLLGMIPLTFIVTYLGGHFNFLNGPSLILGAILVASFFLVPIWIRRKNPWGLYERMKGSTRGLKQTRLA